MKYIKYIIILLILINGIAFGLMTSANKKETEKEIIINQTFYLNKKLLTKLEINSIIIEDENYLDFTKIYSEEVKDFEIASIILQEAIANKIPVNLFFSLAYNESKYYSKSYYKNNNGSIDRGLFQLNNFSRLNWKIEDFYDINKNTKEAARYLVEQYNKYGTWESALVFYNCGSEKNLGNFSIKYLSKILEYENYLDELINERYRDNIIRKNRKIKGTNLSELLLQ